jgi:hypothetical protein
VVNVCLAPVSPLRGKEESPASTQFLIGKEMGNKPYATKPCNRALKASLSEHKASPTSIATVSSSKEQDT